MTDNERVLIDGFRAARRWMEGSAREHFALSDDEWVLVREDDKWDDRYVSDMDAMRAATKLVGR